MRLCASTIGVITRLKGGEPSLSAVYVAGGPAGALVARTATIGERFFTITH